MESTSLTEIAAAGHWGIGTNPLMLIFCIILMAYAVIKVFFANLKRGGILLIQIAVGSLYMFSIPRGYTDGFTQWMKQVIGLCLTAFLQATILVAGLMVFSENALLERDLSRVFFTKTFAVIYEFIFFNFLIKDRQTSVNLNFHVIKENLKRSKLKLV